MIKLYCMGQSGHSYKVANYLNLAGLEWEPVFVDFFSGEARGPEFRALNPMGEVPVFVDGDVRLTQSGVILQYLIDQTGHFAGQPSDKYEILRWVLWDNHKWSSQVGALRFLSNFLPEEKRPEEAIAWLKGRVKDATAVLENHLKDKHFIVGDTLTAADFSCASYLFYPEPWGWKKDETPNIGAWLDRIAAHDGWKHPYDSMPSDQNLINKTPSAAKWHK